MVRLVSNSSEVRVGGVPCVAHTVAGPWVLLHQVDMASSLRGSQAAGVPHGLLRLHHMLDGRCFGQGSLEKQTDRKERYERDIY